MTDYNDAGAAFPMPAVEGYHPHECGMSLRDWFAGQALAGLAQEEGDGAPKYAYFLADAMLAARERKS